MNRSARYPLYWIDPSQKISVERSYSCCGHITLAEPNRSASTSFSDKPPRFSFFLAAILHMDSSACESNGFYQAEGD
jgi:hypothetical protein